MKKFSKKINIALVGHGTMGKIILEILYKMNSFEKIYVVDKYFSEIEVLKKKFSKNVVFSDNINDASLCDVLIFAVKPQDFRNISLHLKDVALVVSIMAGVSIKELAKVLKVKKIIRAMPNMPAKIKKGVVGYFPSKEVSTKERELAQSIFSEMGFSFCLSSEKEINTITAVSGSGPAYVFCMIDSFIKAAHSIGLSSDISKKIVLETFLGSLSLIDKDTDISLLIKSVASKGGTTEAALKEFNKSKTDKIWKKALTEAKKRAKELSNF